MNTKNHRLSISKSITFFALIVLISACGSPKKVDKTNSREKFKLNGYDFILDASHKWGNIMFKIPSCFIKSYYSQGTIQSRSFMRETSTFNGYFFVEEFEESDQYLSFVESQVASKDLLNLFHDAYVKAISDRLIGGVSALKKDLPKSVKYKGVIQVVREYSDDDDPDYYAIATMKIKNKYYTFTWLTGKDMMAYTYDDFVDILETVRLRK